MDDAVIDPDDCLLIVAVDFDVRSVVVLSVGDYFIFDVDCVDDVNDQVVGCSDDLDNDQ